MQLVRVHDAPVAEAVEQAGLHLAGGGLGVGDAEDRVRLGAAQQEARDAVDQDFRLAGAGIGLDPGGMIGQGGLRLAARGGGVFGPFDRSRRSFLASFVGGPFGAARETVIVGDGPDEFDARLGVVGLRRDWRTGRSAP